MISPATLDDLKAIALGALVLLLTTAVGVAIAYLHKIQRKIEATDTTRQTAEVLKYAKGAYSAVNGDGLTGAIQRVEQKVDAARDELKTHGDSDARQFGEIRAYLGMPGDRAGG